MCQVTMNLFDMYGLSKFPRAHILDKLVENTSQQKYPKFHHESKGEGHSKYQKTMTLRTKHATPKNKWGPSVISVMLTEAKHFEDPP